MTELKILSAVGIAAGTCVAGWLIYLPTSEQRDELQTEPIVAAPFTEAVSPKRTTSPSIQIRPAATDEPRTDGVRSGQAEIRSSTEDPVERDEDRPEPPAPTLTAQPAPDDEFADLAEEFTEGIRSSDPAVFEITIRGYHSRHFRHVPREQIFAAIQPMLTKLAVTKDQPRQTQLIRIARAQGGAARPVVPKLLTYINHPEASEELRMAALDAVTSVDVFNPQVRETLFAAAEEGNLTALQLLGKYALEEERSINALVAAVDSDRHAAAAFESLRVIRKRSSKLTLPAAFDRLKRFESCSVEETAEAFGRLQDLAGEVGRIRSADYSLAQHEKILRANQELTEKQKTQHRNQIALARERRARSIRTPGTSEIPNVSAQLVRIVRARPVSHLNRPAVTLLTSWRIPDDPESIRTLVEFGVEFGNTASSARALQHLPTSNPESVVPVIEGFRVCCEDDAAHREMQQEILAGVLGRFGTAAGPARPLILRQLRKMETPPREGTRDIHRTRSLVEALGAIGTEFASDEESRQTWQLLIGQIRKPAETQILTTTIAAAGRLGAPADSALREEYLAELLKVAEAGPAYVTGQCFTAFVESHVYLNRSQQEQLGHLVAGSLEAVMKDGEIKEWQMDILTAPSTATSPALSLSDAMVDWTDDMKAILLKVARSKGRAFNYGPQKGFNKPQVEEAQKVLLNHARKRKQVDTEDDKPNPALPESAQSS